MFKPNWYLMPHVPSASDHMTFPYNSVVLPHSFSMSKQTLWPSIKRACSRLAFMNIAFMNISCPCFPFYLLSALSCGNHPSYELQRLFQSPYLLRPLSKLSNAHMSMDMDEIVLKMYTMCCETC